VRVSRLSTEQERKSLEQELRLGLLQSGLSIFEEVTCNTIMPNETLSSTPARGVFDDRSLRCEDRK
jgi:hypothetical protein